MMMNFTEWKHTPWEEQASPKENLMTENKLSKEQAS